MTLSYVLLTPWAVASRHGQFADSACYAIGTLLQNIKKLSGIFSNIFKNISSCYAIAGSETDVTNWTFSRCRDVPQQQNPMIAKFMPL